MKLKELVYLKILEWPRGSLLTQLALSKKLRASLSTVNNAIVPLKKLGAVTTNGRRLKIISREKILIHWANCRNLQKDIVYETRVDALVTRIETQLPAGAVFTAYSAFRLKYNDAPADYGEVYVYAGLKTLGEIKQRFPKRKGAPNLFVLEKPEHTGASIGEKNLVFDSLAFVDLWNLKEWYAKDFTDALKNKTNF